MLQFPFQSHGSEINLKKGGAREADAQWAQAWKLAKNHYSLISLKLLYHVIDIFLDSKLFTK